MGRHLFDAIAGAFHSVNFHVDALQSTYRRQGISKLGTACCSHRRWVYIPVPATVPRPLLQLSPALVTSLSGALSSLLRETGALPRSRLEQVTQVTSGSLQPVVHTPVAGSKTGSAGHFSLLWRELPLLHA